MPLLEFLSQDEVELAAAIFLGAEYLVEAVGPVNTHHTNHRQEDADTDTGRTFQFERIELADVLPSVTCFYEGLSFQWRM